MSSPSLCQSCFVSFSLFKRKNRCVACQLFYCSPCFKKGQSLPRQSTKQCLKCHAFSSQPFIASELMLLTVRELKAFLQQNNMSSIGCREKRDLVDVIMKHQTPLSNHSVPHTRGSSPAYTTSAATPRDEALHAQSSSSNTPNDPYTLFSDFFGQMQAQSQSSMSPENAQFVGNVFTNVENSFRRMQQPTNNSNVVHNVEGQANSSSINAQFVNNVLENAESTLNRLQPTRTGATTHANQSNMHTSATAEYSTSPDQCHEPRTAWSMPSQKASKALKGLKDYENSDDIRKLSVRELKAVLDENFVDYKGCCEKDELVKRAVMLWESKKSLENASSTVDESTGESDLCKICMDGIIDCVFLECGHLVTCVECGKKLRECPMCRQNIARIVRVFKS